MKACFKTMAARNNALRKFTSKPNEVFPGIFSNTMEYMEFKDELSRQFTTLHPPTVDEFGRTHGDGVRSNAYGLRTMSGERMRPATFPPYSNTKLRKDSGLLPNKLDDKTRLLAQALAHLMIENMEFHDVTISRDSSTCIPYFLAGQKASELKTSLAWRHISDAKLAGNAWLRKKPEIALDHDFLPMSYIVYRGQSTDKITFENGVWAAKDRMVTDLDYALTDGLKGKRFAADKSLDWTDYKVLPGFFAERTRTAMGGPFAYNISLSPIATAIRKGMYANYPFTFKHSTRENKQEKLKDVAVVLAVDVSDHDILFTHDKIDIMAEAFLDKGFADWWVELFKVSLSTSLYVSSPGPDSGHVMIGDLFNPNLTSGLLSGNVFTDILGMFMAVEYLAMQMNYTCPHYWRSVSDLHSAKRFLHDYLKGILPIRQKNKSDDAQLMWTAAADVTKALSLIEKLRDGEVCSSTSIIGYEHGGAFLGDILLYGPDFRVANARYIGNILSFLANEFCPEYSIESQQRDRTKTRRSYPGLAYASQQQVYGSHPLWGQTLELIEDLWQRKFGASYLGMKKKLLDRDLTMLNNDLQRKSREQVYADDLSIQDLEVLVTPSKLSWKYEASDIKPDVAALVSRKLGLAELKPYLQDIIGKGAL